MGFFSDLFGSKDRTRGRHEQEKAAKYSSRVARSGRDYGAGYDAGAAASFGADAGDYMRRAQESARGIADEQARTAAQQGTRQAMQAARTAGLNKGQAALVGAQQAGDIYSQTRQGAMQSGTQNYMAGSGQIAGMGSEMANRQLGAAGVKAGVGGQMQQAGNQALGNTMGMIGNLAGAGAMLLSDKNAKDVTGEPDLRAILQKIRPVRYSYKGEPGASRIGVFAQDIEQTPLKEAVVQTPAGKALDTRELAPATLALLAKLWRRVDAMKGGA